MKRVLFILLAILAVLPRQAVAQNTVVSGTVTDARSGAVVPNATVVVEGFGFSQRSRSGPDGAYTVTDVPTGSSDLVVLGDGYLPSRTALTVLGTPLTIDVRLVTDPHFSPAMPVNPDNKDPFVSFQSADTLAGDALAKDLRETIAATVENQPQVARRAFGPGPARPVIRGLDGDRVLILQDGLRLGDLSDQSGDHGLTIGPAAASRIEILRGPATLLYGANAIGGLVNVVTNDIPAAPVSTPTGSIILDARSGAPGGGAAGDVSVGRDNIAFHASGGGHGFGDVNTPEGTILNSFNRSGTGQVGVSYTSGRGYVGASYAYDRTHYGIPIIGSGKLDVDPQLKRFTVRGTSRELRGPFDAVRGSVSVRRYQHDELDGGRMTTSFTNNTTELELLAHHRPVGRINGSIGTSYLTREFSTAGLPLSPAVDQKGFAGYLYEEIEVAQRLHVQLGGRVDQQKFNPVSGAPARDFTNVSGSVGLFLLPSDTITIALGVAGASRNPALEELYSHGRHSGSNTVENGDPNITLEEVRGGDLTISWRSAIVSGQIGYFFNQFDNFIFRRPTGRVVNGLAEMVFTQADARMQGVQSHLDLRFGMVSLEGELDYVRGDFTFTDVPMPRMPPLRGHGGIRVQKNAVAGGVEGTFVAEQNRVYTVIIDDATVGEAASGSHGLMNVFASYSFASGKTMSTVTARLDNATNALYHNHLDYLKALVPEMGRSFALVYGMKF